MPKVFISHSTKTPYARNVRAHVEAELRRMGLEVLLDEDGIEPGEEWRPKILEWLELCDAAVILGQKAQPSGNVR